MAVARRFTNLTHDVLTAAGWHSGRSATELVADWERQLRQSDGIEMFGAARSALLEFGGLRVRQQGPGLECAREPFELDPTLLLYEHAQLQIYSKRVASKLYPLGEACGDNGFLVIGEDGRVFLILDDIALMGVTVEDALNNLVEGHLAKPL